MTINDSIKHCEDVAAKQCDNECGLEHKQLADWLRELINLRQERAARESNKNPRLIMEERKLKEILDFLSHQPKEYLDAPVVKCIIRVRINGDVEEYKYPKITIKELTIEQKAQRYDEALERARKINSGDGIDTSNGWSTCETIFPELKESEDERMRAMAIKAVYAPEAQSCIKSWGINPDDVIAWLEKQGEQKPLPKDYRDAFDEFMSHIPEKDPEYSTTLYTYEDLEAAMQFGIKWKGEYGHDVVPNPAWREEDEAKLKSILFHIEDVENKDVIDWLKSLKDRMTWKPSEEQMKALHGLNLTGNISYAGQGQTLINLYNDLKKL